jgi:DNA-binding MarR family transcriptional regulator
MPRASRRPEDALTPILDALRRLTRHLRLAERQIEQRVGIGGAQLFTLQQLSQAAALSVNELANLTHTHQSSVSVVVSRLVKRGLATRRQSAEDARRAELRITAAGQQLLRRSPITAQARLIAALERMSPGALARLTELLEHLVTEIGAAAEPASMFFEEEPTRSGKAARQSATDRQRARAQLGTGKGRAGR